MELLSHEETLKLILLAQSGDESAKTKLVNHNLGLVKSIVKKFTGRNVEYEDLMQLGSLGLVRAVMNFDMSFNVRFSTYAVPMIVGEIKRFLRDDGYIKVSRSLKETAQVVYMANERLKNELFRSPTISELEKETGKSCEEIITALDATRIPVSLNEYMSTDDSKKTQIMDLITGDDGEKSLENIMLRELLSRLNTK